MGWEIDIGLQKFRFPKLLFFNPPIITDHWNSS